MTTDCCCNILTGPEFRRGIPTSNCCGVLPAQILASLAGCIGTDLLLTHQIVSGADQWRGSVQLGSKCLYAYLTANSVQAVLNCICKTETCGTFPSTSFGRWFAGSLFCPGGGSPAFVCAPFYGSGGAVGHIVAVGSLNGDCCGGSTTSDTPFVLSVP